MRRLLPLALLAAVAAAQETPATAWTALQKEYRDARTEFFRPWREAKAKGEALTLDYTKHPDRTFPGRFRAFALEHAGQPVAAAAWAEVVRLGPTEEAKVEALGVLFEHHMDSKALRSVIWSLRFRKDAEQRLQTIAEKSTHAELRGLALLVRGRVVKRRDTAGAKAIFDEVKEKYGDQAYSGKTTLAQKVAREMFELEKLAIGAIVPEIEGEDIDGVAFKLSDYRGKVVMIDFWGDW